MNTIDLEKVARSCHNAWREFIDEESYDELVSKDVWLAIAKSAIETQTKIFAEHCKDAMELRENSWSSTILQYEISIRNAVVQIFGNDPMGTIAFLVIYLAWNDVADWVKNPEPCSKEHFKEKRWM